MITANIIKKGKGCSIHPEATVGYKEHGGSITLGSGVAINKGCIIRTCTGNIILGNKVSIGCNCILHGFGGITIGENTMLSPGVHIYAQNHGLSKSKPIRSQRQTHKGVKIGQDCWIGANAIITDDIVVGNGSVVGAGSVVTKNIPEYEIWAGNPAKFIKKR